MRIGFGYDVHKISFGNETTQIMLCNVPIASDFSIVAHSDGDVAMHALVDALLGAISKGDIGILFPNSDPRWKDCDSSHFLLEAHKLIKIEGYKVGNIDITIVCEKPKISPHKEKMISKIAELLEISVKQVSVKATTTESLGFEGKLEGIKAYAIVLLLSNH